MGLGPMVKPSKAGCCWVGKEGQFYCSWSSLSVAQFHLIRSHLQLRYHTCPTSTLGSWVLYFVVERNAFTEVDRQVQLSMQRSAGL